MIPACSGELPSTFWKNWLRKKIEPNIPKYIASETTLVTAKPRLAKNSIGSIGASERSSLITNATTSAAPAASETTTSVEPQPSDWLRTSPNTIPNRPSEPYSSPDRSRRDLAGP